MEKRFEGIEVRFDSPKKIKLTVVGMRPICERLGIPLSQMFESLPVGSELYLSVEPDDAEYPGSISVLRGLSERIGSIATEDIHHIKLAIPQDGNLKCVITGQSLEHKSIIVEAVNNVGICKPEIAISEPLDGEMIFSCTEYDKEIHTITKLLRTQLKEENPKVEQVLKLTQKFAKICCTTLDGETFYAVYDLLRLIDKLNEKFPIFDAVRSEIFEAAKDLKRYIGDVKTEVYLSQYKRIHDSALEHKNGEPSQFDDYIYSLKFINNGKLTLDIIDAEITKLSHLLSKELTNKYQKRVRDDVKFADNLFYNRYSLRSMYVLYTRRIKLKYLQKLREEMIDEEEAKNQVPLSDLFDKETGIIKDVGDMWLLLIAAEARKKQFDNLPKFVDWAIGNFDVPFDKEECTKKLQDKLKSKSWSAVTDQMSMKEFIKDFRVQPNKRSYDMKRANAIFVAIKEKTIGEN